jgi:hypothetical protein
MRPLAGGRRPARSQRRVVLPEPLGPTSAVIWPRGRAKLMSRRTGRPARAKWRARAWREGGMRVVRGQRSEKRREKREEGRALGVIGLVLVIGAQRS